MFRALYDFQATEGTSLSFEASDQFTVMDTSDPYWWLVQNGYGQVGYVPANYLQHDEVGDPKITTCIELQAKKQLSCCHICQEC